MKIKTQDLTGPALDWAVAKCEGKCEGDFAWYYDRRHTFNYSTDWSQGGPIIEREGIAIDCVRCGGQVDGWIAALPMYCEAKYEDPSPTPLIAAMRCFVASQLGDEVDVPEELRS